MRIRRKVYKVGAEPQIFPISCARACTVACEVSTEAQFFADCKLHILTRSTSFGCRQFLEKTLTFVAFLNFPDDDPMQRV